MSKPNEVELVIKAKRDAEKAIDELTKSLEELDKVADKNSLGDLFSEFEVSADKLIKKKDIVDKKLKDAKAAQKALAVAAQFAKSVDTQTAAVDKTATKLKLLEDAYQDVAKAAQAAREPSEKLTASLAANQKRQAELLDTLSAKSNDLLNAQNALANNTGLDERANAAIQRQKKAILEAGKSWRELTEEINKTKRAQVEAAQTVSATQSAKEAGAQRLAALRAELAQTKDLFAQLDKARRSGTAGGATQRLAIDAKARLAELKASITAERQSQAQLDNDFAAASARLRRQTELIGKLKDTAVNLKQEYSSLSKGLNGFVEEQRRVGEGRQQAQIAALSQQVGELSKRYDSASEKAVKLSEALARSTTPDPKAVAQFDRLTGEITRTREELTRQQEILNKTQAEYAAAGVSAESLAADQERLANTTDKLTRESQELETQIKQANGEARNAKQAFGSMGKAVLGLGEDTRKSLGLVQRLKGELLALAATYSGIYAVGGAVRSIYEAGALQAKAESRFSVFFGGDTKRVAEELKFVRAESDRLGISYETALDQYSKFISGLTSDTPVKYARQVFTGFSTAATVAKISEEELKRVFTAVTQIFGKQQVQLEELKGQLADALPGAIEKTAKALKLTVPELTKLVEEGKVGQEAAILLAAELEKSYGTRLDDALKGPQAQLNLFGNAVADLKKEIGQSGFLDQLTIGLKEVTAAIKTPEFKQGAKDIADGITQIIKVGVLLVKNFKEVKETVTLLLEIFVAKKVLQFSLEIFEAGRAVQAFAKTLTVATPALASFIGQLGLWLARLPALGAAATGGFFIGDWLQENVAVVRKYGVQLVTDVDRVITVITGNLRKLYAVWEATFVNLSFEGLGDRLDQIEKETEEKYKTINQITKDMMDDIDKEFSQAKSPISSDLAKAEAEKIKTVITDIQRFAEETFSGTKNVFPFKSEDELKKASEQNKRYFLKNIEETSAEAAKIQNAQAQLSEEELSKLREDAIRENAEKQRESAAKLASKIRDRLAEIDREIQEKSADTLEQRISAIAGEYSKLLEDIRKAGGESKFPGAEDSIKQITAIKQVAEVEKEINRLVNERKELSSAIYERAELGEITLQQAAQQVNAENARIIPLLDEALLKAKEISDQIGSKPISQSVDNQAEIVSTEKLRASREQVLNVEKQLDEAMDVRAAKIQTISALQDAGAITEYEAKQKIIEINAQTNQQLSDELLLLEELINGNEKLRDSTYGQETLEKIKQAKIELGGVKDQILDAQEVNEQFASGFTNAFDDFVSGTKSAKEAFKSFIADFLRNIAKAILQALIFRAISGGTTGGGGLGGSLSSLVGQNHSGGMVGSKRVLRQIDPSVFVGAVRYHSGGIAGLKPNEMPTILEKGEEVLTRNDPRHALNGGVGGQGQSSNVQIVNTIDVESLIGSIFSNSRTSKQIINVISANKSSVKTALGG